jgi:hypothetical protein
MGVSLDYSVSVTAGSIGEVPAYIRDWHINTVELVSTGGAGNNYASQLAYLKGLGVKPVLDIEMDIWAGGQIQSPIGNFTSFLQSCKAAGWPTLSSEGGRAGDPSFIKGLGLGYINYNCDQCGLWQNIYSDVGTVMNLWECYYPSEVGYITDGASATKGKANGVLAGAWRDAAEHSKCYYSKDAPNYANAPNKKFKGDNDILQNSINGAQPSYESIIDSLVALGCSVTRFDVWGGTASSRAQNQACGFDSIVANLQKNHPPNGIGPAPPSPVTKKPTTIGVTSDKRCVGVNKPVTFTVTLKDGNTPIPREVTFYHTLNGVRYNDKTAFSTLTVPVSFTSPGIRYYYASFAGDENYLGSTSAVLPICVCSEIQ